MIAKEIIENDLIKQFVGQKCVLITGDERDIQLRIKSHL